MFTFLIVIIAIIGLVLTLLVLLQAGRGGGLAGIAAGGTQQVLGARQAPDVLEKATWGLATLFLVLCLLTNFTIDRGETPESVIQQRARGAQTGQQVPALPPAGETGGQTGGAAQEGNALPPVPEGGAGEDDGTPQQ